MGVSSLLAAMCRLLSKYPARGQVFQDSCSAVLALKNSLPLEISDLIRQVQREILKAISRFDLTKDNLVLVDCAFNVLILLWNRYPKQLPAECNMDHLSCVMKAALNVGEHGQKMGALQLGQDFVSFIMRLLNDGQLATLGENGVGHRLCSLLSYYDDMSRNTLQQLVVGVGMLAEVRFDVQAFVGDNLHVSLLFAARKHFSDSIIQELIWRLFSVIIRKDVSFVKELSSCGVVPAIASITQEEGFIPMPLIRFLTHCCHRSPDPFLKLILENELLMGSLLKIIDTETKHSLESVTNACDFLAYLCTKVPPRQSGPIIDLAVVSKIEACARKWPEACLLQACLAIEGVCTPPLGAVNADIEKKREEFFSRDHHVFAKDMLCDPVVSQNSTLVELVYVLFQKLLRASPPATLHTMCNKEFIEALVMLFARDIFSFPYQANRIAFTMHYFVFQMKQKECFEHLRELSFHTFVVDLIEVSNSYEVTATSLGLLASLLGKYYMHFKNVNILLETQLPELLIRKCAQYKQQQTSQFGEDFGRILLNITADKDMSLQLHKRGYMDKLLHLLNEGYAPVVRRSIIHAVGNISLGSQSIKQELHESQFHEILLSTLENESLKGDTFLLSACCRVLHILASGDRAKRLFVERGCVQLLLDLMKIPRGDTKSHSEEVVWRSLSLLSSLGFIAVTNRRYVLTAKVIEQVAEILQSSKNGKIISYVVLVFLGAGELDEGAVKLRQLKVEESLDQAMYKVAYKAQAPDLDRWCSHVLEKQYLYTMLAPSDSLTSPPPLPVSTARQYDWPRLLTECDGSMETDTDRETHRLLPLEEEYMTPQHPVALELGPTAQQQLRELGLDPQQPLFRIGRVYGSTYGFCSNCDRESISEELVIRPHSLTPHQYQDLIDNGWYRRGGVKMFRLRYNHNVYHADWETHVNALKFDQRSHKSYGRVLRRMPKERLVVETLPTHFNHEAFDLYNAYHIAKHDKPLKSMFSYTEHIVNSPIMLQTVDGVQYGTFHQLYRLDGKLVAIGIIDVVPKGIVSIYMWYDVSKAVSKFSFGVYSALKEIELVCKYHQSNPGMQNYYLQGWNRLNKKLAYKSNYGPGHFYCPTIVEDWVEGEEGVDKSQAAYIEKKREGEREREQRGGETLLANGGEEQQQNSDENVNSSSSSPNTHQSATATTVPRSSCNGHSDNRSQEDMDTTDGKTETKKDDEASTVATQVNCKPADSAEDKNSDSNTPTDPVYSCEAYPNDLARYQAKTGESTVDIHTIVVCLNYTEYRRLGDVMDQYQIPDSQCKVLEQRLSELVVTLSPRLLSQLVIDFKVCSPSHSSSSIPVSQESRPTVETEELAL